MPSQGAGAPAQGVTRVVAAVVSVAVVTDENVIPASVLSPGGALLAHVKAAVEEATLAVAIAVGPPAPPEDVVKICNAHTLIQVKPEEKWCSRS